MVVWRIQKFRYNLQIYLETKPQPTVVHIVLSLFILVTRFLVLKTKGTCRLLFTECCTCCFHGIYGFKWGFVLFVEYIHMYSSEAPSAILMSLLVAVKLLQLSRSAKSTAPILRTDRWFNLKIKTFRWCPLLLNVSPRVSHSSQWV